MKRRVKSFLLAILMVFTILPTNFTTVEADNKDIQIIIASNIGEYLDKKILKIQLFGNDSEVSSENIKLPSTTSSEIAYQELWKLFFKTIAIRERTNSRCQMQFMPKKYWQDLIEEP